MSDGGDERRAAMTAAAVQIAVRGLRKSFGRNGCSTVSTSIAAAARAWS